ncbi:hypothetical protein BS50DRAFT_269101 [Corynespora cassiicola Philippines]|uniref:Rhodopsin domain-containing protein n=1 Tax=Corynespora cassiicola Philippines TaxID=1448308 RepID=A0A2T2NZP7_CORCC|nr:hypothetical protein BS50DRAFT_269101 [Corynespora cassiicola Philippines]
MVIAGPEEGPRYAPSGRGGAVLVSLYTWTCITLGVACARFIIGRIHKVNFGPDDGMVLTGSILYLAATVSWQYAVDAGLGKHISEVSPSDADIYFKTKYAGQLLAVVVMTLGKLSSAFLIGRVAPQSLLNKVVLFGSVVSWSVYSLFAVAFQCGTSQPWVMNEQKCHGGSLMVSVIVFDMVSDILLAVWILPVLRPLHMDRRRRRTVAILFGARIIVPFVGGVQVWAAIKAAQTEDPTWDGFALAILTKTVSSLSLIIASLPRIKRFLGAGGSGMLYPQIDDTEIVLSAMGPSKGGSHGDEPLKLVPSSSGQFTTTVESGSGKGKQKEKSKTQQDWQKFVSIGSKRDEHTSTSSLFDNADGVVRQQEVTVEIGRSE